MDQILGHFESFGEGIILLDKNSQILQTLHLRKITKPLLKCVNEVFQNALC